MSSVAVQRKPSDSLASRLNEARDRTDSLFRLVRPEALLDRPIAERHRILFYIGHLEAFDWNLLGRRTLGLDSFQEKFDHLFAFGIDPVGGGLPDDKATDWPPISEVRGYCETVRETLDRRLAESRRDAAGRERTGMLLQAAIEHRLMHAETLAYMLHRLPLDRKLAKLDSLPAEQPAPPARLIEIAAGEARLGLDPSEESPFGWDNEFEAHTVSVPAFSIDACKVTNAQFLEFVRAGGYDERSLWTDADWAWKAEGEVRHPAFWAEQDGKWFYRGMYGKIPLPASWPVYASHAEASAYARWRGLSLPTEAQFHRAAYGTAGGRERAYPWGDVAPSAKHGNFNFARWDPVSVDAHPAGASAFGVEGLVGNGWEWTATKFEPFAGFRAYDFYPNYSAPFFDGQHWVMKGGSMQTAACLLRRSFRNWFQGHYPYVYAGFRCVAN